MSSESLCMPEFGSLAWWRRIPLRAKSIMVTGVPVAVIVIGLPLLFGVQRSAAEIGDTVERTYRIRQSVGNVLQHLVDAETGIRGYLLTNQPAFLEPYRSGAAAVPDDLDQLERQLRGDRLARSDFVLLRELADERLRLMEKIRHFGATTPAGAIPESLLERGRLLMVDVRAVVGRMDAEVAVTLASDRDRLRNAQRTAFLVSVVVVPAALLLTILGVVAFTTRLVRCIRTIEENARRLERGEVLLDPPHGDDELARLGRVLAHTATRLAEQEAELRELALVDPLTGLPNRRAFLQIAEHELQLAARQASVSALLFIDADGLKRVNDDLGHGAGDQILIEIGEILRAELRASDLIARLGGDEFCVLLSRDSALEGSDLTRRLEAAVIAHNEHRDDRYRLAFSIGVAIFDPVDPVPIEELIRRADAEMYQQKRAKQITRAAS